MSGGICGKIQMYPQQIRQPLELPVMVVQGYTILFVCNRRIRGCQNGKDVGPIFRISGIPIDYQIHTWFQPHAQPLSGLSADIADRSVGDIRFAQKSHIHKSHPAGAEAEDEKVSGHRQGR